MIIGQLQNFDLANFGKNKYPQKWWNIISDNKNMFSIKKTTIEIIRGLEKVCEIFSGFVATSQVDP